MMELDGSHGEGGGALVRTALALSTLTGKEFKVTNIRSGRKQPGLKAQHLNAINALKEICNAKTNNVQLGSTELTYKPGEIKSGTFNIDIGTAGSITLLLQALILPCMFAPGRITITITGGTCGKWQASVDYLQHLLLPHLKKFVEKIELKILKRGYYPKGGGKIALEITPRLKLKDFPDFNIFYKELQDVQNIKLMEQGTLEHIKGIVNLSTELQNKEVGERIKNSAEVDLKRYNVPITIDVEYTKSRSVGGEIVLMGIFSEAGEIDDDNPIIIGGDALVEKGKSSETIGKEAADKLSREIDGGFPVDRHLADQLIPFMALLPGSEITVREISDHAKTNIYVAEKFLPLNFTIKGNKISVKKFYK